MGQDIFEISVNTIKFLVIFFMMIQAVPLLVWIERRGSAFIQNRFGPNRVGPLGLTQLLADAVKFIFKEPFVPQNAIKYLFLSAPILALIPAALAFLALPLSTPIHVESFEWLGRSWGPYIFDIRGVSIDIGIIYILGVSSLGAYGLLIAGFASGNKYSLLGALRASAQMISYELALSLSIVGALIFYATFDLTEMVAYQQGFLSMNLLGFHTTIGFLPNWGIFFQPIGAILFLVAAFAESNRLPFDLPETEAELVAGFHTEYGGFKMLVFFMAEYGHIMVSSLLFSLLFLGGWNIPFVTEESLRSFITGHLSNMNIEGTTYINIATALFFHIVLLLKMGFLLWLFIWIRWTLPRFRYDRLMDFGWKTMLPWALGNTLLTAFFVYLMNME